MTQAFDIYELLGMAEEQLTPEWNIAYYEKLLKYTKHSVRRKKLKEELKWWQEHQKAWHKAKEIIEAAEAE